MTANAEKEKEEVIAEKVKSGVIKKMEKDSHLGKT